MNDSTAVPVSVAQAVEVAKAAGLTYVRDDEPGIRRVRCGDGFRYVAANGDPVTDRKALDRIAALAIPPAYEDVWICTNPRGHLQATGRDARGRKQYRYHPEWTRARGDHKHSRMRSFGKALRRLRTAVRRD